MIAFLDFTTYQSSRSLSEGSKGSNLKVSEQNSLHDVLIVFSRNHSLSNGRKAIQDLNITLYMENNQLSIGPQKYCLLI